MSLAPLPATAGRLADAWDLHPAGAPFTGGTTAYVLPLDRADGTPAVLKLDLQDVENRSEPTALHAYDSDGAGRLLEYDPETGAMLLESARPGTALLARRFPGLSEHDAARERFAIACDLFRRLWRAPGPRRQLPRDPRRARDRQWRPPRHPERLSRTPARQGCINAARCTVSPG